MKVELIFLEAKHSHSHTHAQIHTHTHAKYSFAFFGLCKLNSFNSCFVHTDAKTGLITVCVHLTFVTI